MATTDSIYRHQRAADFSGLYGAGDSMNMALGYAAEGCNFCISNHSLTSMHRGTPLPGSLSGSIGTLALLHRRFSRPAGQDARLLAAVSEGCLYVRDLSASGWTKVYSGFALDDFDWVCYEVNRDANGNDSANPIDVLLLTNAQDGMYCLYGDSLKVRKVTIQPDLSKPEIRFGVLARHCERIWGSGIAGDPDRLMYSVPYDPFDWSQNDAIPEDGAGDIFQPSWDGDSFIALRPYGSYLLALKKSRVWRIIGSDPGTYVMKEQFGGGAICENTVCVHSSLAYMLGYDGLMRYDGVDVSRFGQAAVDSVLTRLSQAGMSRASAAVYRDFYLLAVALDGSAVNNALLIYDIPHQRFTLAEGVGVRAFLVDGDQLYLTNEAAPGEVILAEGGDALPMRYVSGWQNQADPALEKRAFRVYLTSETDAEFSVGIRTERSLRHKRVALRAGKRRCIHLPNHGHRWRLELACDQTREWRLVDGIDVYLDVDAEQ
ncbi:MAG: hypothetical protein Q4E13_01730 [Clostridia bacterium]|nr:hypothetical protein [Clostridia bacterium]